MNWSGGQDVDEVVRDCAAFVRRWLGRADFHIAVNGD
jgi:hypothetical protein